MKASDYDPVIRNKFPRPVNPMAVGVDWGARGFRCHKMLDPPGRVRSDGAHGANKLLIVLKGRLEIDIAGTLIEAEEGDEIFIPGDAVHTIRNTAPSPTRWLCGYEGTAG